MTFRAMFLVLLVGILPLARTAHAQSEKSPAMAVTLSLAASLVPIAAGTVLALSADSNSTQVVAGVGLASLGAIIGPSMGRLYAGDSSWTSGMAIRALGAGLGIGAVLVVNELNDQDENICLAVAGVALVGGGAVLILGSLVDDVGKAAASAKRTQHPSGLSHFEIQPAYFVRDRAAGLRLSITL